MYRGDIIINAPVQFVMKFIEDPLIIAGISGHIAILKFKDKVKDEYLFGDKIKELSAPTNEFKVLYILLKSDGTFKYAEGVFIGPEVTMENGIRYFGYTDDSKLEFEINFILKGLGENLTSIHFATTVKYNDSLLERLLGRSTVDLARHIVEDHFITYIRVYFSAFVSFIHSIELIEKSSPSSISLPPISQFTGDAGSVLVKINEITTQLDLGVIKVKFDGLTCSIIVENKAMKKAVCKSDGETRTDFEALSMILSAKGQGKMEVYAINVEDIIESLSILA